MKKQLIKKINNVIKECHKIHNLKIWHYVKNTISSIILLFETEIHFDDSKKEINNKWEDMYNDLEKIHCFLVKKEYNLLKDELYKSFNEWELFISVLLDLLPNEIQVIYKKYNLYKIKKDDV